MFAPLLALLLAVPAQQASDAQIAAWIVDDLRRDSRLDPLAAAERLHAAGLRDDLYLARAVGGRLAGAGAPEVIVGVHDGEIVLHGRARDEAQRGQLLALASDVQGVRGIDSRLLLLPGEEPAPPAPVLLLPEPVAPAQGGAFSFLTGDGLAGRDIEVRVDEGVATLTGEACSVDAQLYATGVAQRVPGVRAVRNRLAVRAKDDPADRRLALLIERQLEDDVLVQGVSNAILVKVRHGVVQLTGTVRDEGQHAQAERVAARIGAAFAVDNRLLVDEDLVLPSKGRIPGFKAFKQP